MQLLSELPLHLQQRARLHPHSKTPQPATGRACVLYWMQTAMRLDDNPALELAGWLSERLKLPLLVYQGVSSRHEYASDRHHTFILEGAYDLQQAAAERGIHYALYIERDRNQSPLAQLISQAAVTVIEDMPTDPHRMFVRAALRSADCPFIAVDAACVVPMQLVGQSYERAFEYRNKTRRLRSSVVKRVEGLNAGALSYGESLNAGAFSYGGVLSSGALGCERIELRAIPELVAQCDIDHSIAPVKDTRGGMVAAVARWEEFKATKLRRYADNRNDPLKNPSSRLSAYLHYGMISPMRVAREAAAVGGEGAEKFLDELLIWRELAYTFCFYRPDHHLWSAIPDWARATLDKHATDQREYRYTWEELARAQTHDELWNVAQRSLLLNGELHNNVRMTWGKAILEWCQPRQALRLMIDLNHRYALDGRDPASYGGLLWCLGQFDRPFAPEQPVVGTVRSRPTSEHAQRLNVQAYDTQVRQATRSYLKRFAVIGAGLSGLVAARALADLGHTVTVFEKSRGPAGRMSTRHATHGDFDHGAQYFTCRDPRFRRYVDSWLDSGVVARWNSPIAVYEHGHQVGQSQTERLVAVPHMNALGKHLSVDLNVLYGKKITCLERSGEAWQLRDEEAQEFGPFDRVVVTLPAPQAAELLIDACADLATQLRMRDYAPCWAVMLNLVQPLPVAWGGAFINSGPVRWLARNQTKPGRPPAPECLVLHAQGNWSSEHFDDQPEQVIAQLTAAVQAELGIELPTITYSAAHRWRYAMPTSERALPLRALHNQDHSLIACGDWASGSRVEGAFLSGMAAVGISAS